jgi:hypothetical protein
VDARAKREHDDREWSFQRARLPNSLNRTAVRSSPAMTTENGFLPRFEMQKAVPK